MAMVRVWHIAHVIKLASEPINGFWGYTLAKRQIEKKPPLPPPDDSCYAGWETWKNHRWAWEFLRRDVEFVEACNRVADGKDDAKAVAKRFHLRRLKRYDELYETADTTNPKVKPAFILSSVPGIQVPVNESELKEARQRIRRLTLDIGQVVVRFDLSVATEYPKRLDGQIASVTKALDKQLKRLQSATGVGDKKSRNRPTGGDLLNWLKALDMQKIDCTDEQRGDAFFGNASNATDSYKHILSNARRYAKEDFLKLAADATKRPRMESKKT